MWFDDLKPEWRWSGLWYNHIRCGCGGIRGLKGACPACGEMLVDHEPLDIQLPDGSRVPSPQNCYAGGEAGYQDYMYLEMIEREWKRPVTEADRVRSFGAANPPSPRAVIVALFWSYFETRIERLLRASMRSLPERVTEDLLTRYAVIGARLDRLYRILFDTTYRADLSAVGFERVGQHLDRVQDARNSFTHGDPEAIDDAIVETVVENLKSEHESWIAVFNRRRVRV